MVRQNAEIEEKSSWFSKNGRKITGYGLLIGDAALAIDGAIQMQQAKKEGDTDKYNAGRNELMVGAGYALGGAAMARYGNRTMDKQFTDLQQKLAAYFDKEGITLSREYLEKAKKENNRGFFAKIEDFCYQHPTEIMNATFGLLSTLLIKNGLKEYNQEKKFGTLTMGILTMSGALSGLLIKEKPPEQLAEEGPSKGGFDSVKRWAQRNSLAITGGLYALNNLGTIQSSRERYKTYNDPNYQILDSTGKVDSKKGYNAELAQQPLFQNLWIFRALTAASYLFSNLTMTTLKKGASGSEELLEQTRDKILQETAEILRTQPKETQQQLIKQTAEYLSSRKELNMERLNKQDIVEKLTEALNKQPQNWVNRSNQVPSGSDRTV